MERANHIVMGVHITDRVRHVPEVQKVLTDFGCYIKTRLGLHETGSTSCSPNGLLILELLCDAAKTVDLAERLTAVEGVEVQTMTFKHQ